MSKELTFWDAPFVLCMNKQVLDHPYILQVAFPHYVGKLLLFPTALSYVEWLATADEKHLSHAQLPGYRIAVVFAGALSGHRVYATVGWDRELDALLKNMAEFYLEHTVKQNLSLYQKKYAL